MKQKSTPPSAETTQEAMKLAKAIQKPNQTKEQTKLVAQGIEKGITLYKKQQKQKARDADKVRKRTQKQKQAVKVDDTHDNHTEVDTATSPNKISVILPWILLFVSWVGFALYLQR